MTSSPAPLASRGSPLALTPAAYDRKARRRSRKSESYSHSVHHTPYQRRRSYRLSEKKNDVQDEAGIDLEGLSKKSWKLYKVSPLWKFNYSTKSFKHYSRKLKEGLASEDDDTRRGETYESHFEKLSSFESSSLDEDAVMVTVSTRVQDIVKVVYVGVLLSQGCSTREDGFVKLPLLLCQGNAKITLSVHKLLGKFFDCEILPLIVSHSDMMWLTCLFIGNHDRQTPPGVLFHFVDMNQFSSRCAIVITMSRDGLERLWFSIHNKDSADVTSNEVNQFHRCLQEHILWFMKLNVKKLSISRLQLPDFAVWYTGKVYALKLHSVKNATKVFQFLCDLCNDLDTSCPAMDVGEVGPFVNT